MSFSIPEVNPGSFGQDHPQGMFDFSPKPPPVYQVTDLVRLANRLLEDHFERVFVEGEVDSLKLHSSGHVYFSLKDTNSCINAVMMRGKAQKVRFPLKNGMKVRVLGHLGLYEPQGKFQLYVDELLLTGDGELMQAFEELKRKLQQEGLFSPDRKRPLPKFPRIVGLATSLDGAVLRDILRVAMRRGKVRFLVSQCLVQGDGAPEQICAAIERLQEHVDVIIVARGGGSTTDLWAFNNEKLARTIAACKVPVVSAVGHEVDHTIADGVADVRAPTPSAAAECVVPEFALLAAELADLHQRLLRVNQRTIITARQMLDTELSKAQHSLQKQVARTRQSFATILQHLTEQHPRARLLRNRSELEKLRITLSNANSTLFAKKRQDFSNLIGKLNTLSPLQVLGRGYAVALDKHGHVLTEAKTTQVGESIQVRLHQGQLFCKVEQITSPLTNTNGSPD